MSRQNRKPITEIFPWLGIVRGALFVPELHVNQPWDFLYLNEMIELMSEPEARKVRSIDCVCGSSKVFMPAPEVELRPMMVQVDLNEWREPEVTMVDAIAFLDDAFGAWSAMIEVKCASCGQVREMCRDRLLGRE